MMDNDGQGKENRVVGNQSITVFNVPSALRWDLKKRREIPPENCATPSLYNRFPAKSRKSTIHE
jgi:hypothetical protein